MASELGVQTIQHTNGTDALTIDSSGIVTMANTVMYDTYRLTANVTANQTITDWEQPDNSIMATVGDSMSVASGIFTFPRTGIYRVFGCALIDNASGDGVTGFEIQGTTDNSSYSLLSYMRSGNGGSSANYDSVAGEIVVNISNTSTHKIRFVSSSVGTGSIVLGNTDQNRTYVSFQYLAPST